MSVDDVLAGRAQRFDDRIDAQDFDKMPLEYRKLLTRVLTIQADCEIGGPHLYVDRWVLRGPNADDQWRLARIAAEEIDHFRKFNRLLNQLGLDASDRLRVSKDQRFVDAFKRDMPSWADIAMFALLIDRVGEYQLQEFVDCSYQPINRILPGIMAEEKGHVAFGYHKTRALLEQGKHDDVQAALHRWYPEALDMFGSSTSQRSQRYIAWGLKRRTNEQARQAYKAEVDAVLAELGLTPPDVTGKLKHA